MRTIFRENEYKILNLFYNNKNTAMHLRGIARALNISAGPLTRHINKMTKEKILTEEKEANLRKFKVRKEEEIFPLFAMEEYNRLNKKEKEKTDKLILEGTIFVIKTKKGIKAIKNLNNEKIKELKKIQGTPLNNQTQYYTLKKRT